MNFEILVNFQLVVEMSRLKIIVIGLFGIIWISSCRESKDKRNEALSDAGPAVNPRFKLDKDTINLGDSLTGIIGVVFKPSIAGTERQLLTKSLSYRIDTTDTDLTNDAQFYSTKKINDTTFRFAILPVHHDSVTFEKKWVYASVKVLTHSTDNQKQDYIFRSQFEYYVKK